MEINTKVDIYNTVETEALYDNSKVEIKPNVIRENDFAIFYEKLFTDGEIYKVIENETKDISNYKVKNNENLTLHKKQTFIKNAGYIIVITFEEKWINFQNGAGGWNKIVKDIQIFLNNKKDRKSLKSAREEINNYLKGFYSEQIDCGRIRVHKLCR